MTTTRSVLLVVYDWGEEWITPFKLPKGAGIRGGTGGKDTPGRLHLFVFLSGTIKEEVNINNKEEKTLLIPITVVMADASPEVRWLTERSSAVRYVVIVVSEYFGGRGSTRSCAFTFPLITCGCSLA